jgi:hypothetical protein
MKRYRHPSLSKQETEIIERLVKGDIKAMLVTPDVVGSILRLLSLRLVGGRQQTSNGVVVFLTNRAQWMFEETKWSKWKN